MADIVFMALHGENGENGKLQAAFDLYGIKYTGSDYLSSAIAMNKELAKKMFLAAGIPTPKGISMTRENRLDDVTKLPLSLPCVVKPCCGGSSIGVTIANNDAEFRAALDDAFRWENELVIEEFVRGREFSVGVIEGKALPVIEIAPIQGFYDYKNKYKAGSAVETCPADLPEEISAQMRTYAEQVAKVLGLSTYSRSDFMLDEQGRMFCLEANTLPGMTPTSLLPQEAAAVDMDFNELCEKIIAISLAKYED
jgi:D-alanine-D-alanine ligase